VAVPAPAADVTAPTISAPACSPITSTTATCCWTTNELSSTQIDYGTGGGAYESQTALVAALVLSHCQQITGLVASTTYDWRGLSRDAAGNLATDSNRNFTTTALAIDAVADSGSCQNDAACTPVANVRANDTFNGSTPPAGGLTTIATSGSWPSGITLNTSTGAVSVAISTAAAVYALTYTLCEVAVPTNCDTATVTVTVTTPPMAAGSCMDSVGSSETAVSSDRTYTYATNNYGVDATGVTWTPAYSSTVEAINTSGAGTGACWNRGTLDGPFDRALDERIVYETGSEHLPSGGCAAHGGSCLAYHTTAGHAPTNTGSFTINFTSIIDWGDGISRDNNLGTAYYTYADNYIADIHDDAIEDDWLRGATIRDNLVEFAFMFLAWHKRSGGPEQCASGTEMIVDGNLVQLWRFYNAYQQKDGHGGFWKIDNDQDDRCRWRITNNLFLAGPEAGDQWVVPPIERIIECSNNTLLWTGTQADYDAWMAERDSASIGDSGPFVLAGASGTYDDNGERMAFLESYGCYTVVVKPGGQSISDFLEANWRPSRDAWCDDHPGQCRAYNPYSDW
jgi:hypothetical protein